MRSLWTWWSEMPRGMKLAALGLLIGAVSATGAGLSRQGRYADWLLYLGAQLTAALLLFLPLEARLRDRRHSPPAQAAAPRPAESQPVAQAVQVAVASGEAPAAEDETDESEVSDAERLATDETDEMALAMMHRKDILIADLGSVDREVALHAAERLRRHGWLTDGSLQGETLQGANLEGAVLTGANMQVVNLVGANLRRADLVGAKLQVADLVNAKLDGAFLRDANLQGANLGFASLQGTSMMFTNLKRANLWGANLEGAMMEGANLEEAILEGTRFDTRTILPDGAPWSPDAVLERYTNPEYEHFWRADNVRSPAYQGH